VTSTLIASDGAGWITVSNSGVPNSNVVYLGVGNSEATIHVVASDYTVDSGSQNIAEGDLNGDGSMDLVTSDTSSYVEVWKPLNPSSRQRLPKMRRPAAS
jgi:hypothetical protein